MAPIRPTASRARWLLAVTAGAFAIAGWVAGQDAPAPVRRPVPEYEVKAAFLLNFVKFVAWPTTDVSRAASSFDICIIGDDPFGAALDRLVEGETADDRSIAIIRIPKWEERKENEQCRVLFVSGSERNAPAILNQAGKGVLTVGESPDFLRSGGVINFFLDDHKVRFDVNRAAAERESLQISSRLLGVARSVQR